MRWVACLLLMGCGRIGFDAGGSALGDGGAGSGSDADAGPVDIASNLIVHYPLDETLFTSTAADVGPNGLDATCIVGLTCPLATPGHIDGAASFGGVSQRLRTAYIPAFNTTSGFTIAAWVQPMNMFTSGSILAKPHAASATANSWQVENPGTGQYRFKVRSATLFDEEVLSSSFSIGTWQHVAGTWDGATVRFYVDGVEQGWLSTTDIVFDTGDVVIGADINNSVEGGFFLGSIDDVRIYGRGLTAAEVMMLASM